MTDDDTNGAAEAEAEAEAEDVDDSAVTGESSGATDIPDALRGRVESDPYCATLDIELVDLRPGRARTRFDVTEETLNFHGTVHGGAVYSLADAAFAAASNSHGETAVALETNISYLSAVEAGATLEAVARETHRTKRTAEYEVVVRDDEDDRIATFRGRVYRP